MYKTTELAIDVKNLCKNFLDVPIVKNVTLQIKQGEIFGFLGPNGSGKTTTMRMLCGLLKASSGEGHCLGHDILTETEAIKRQVGYMPQFFSLYKNMTVRENLKLMAELYGLINREQLVRNAIDDFNLGPYRHQLAGSLSGGWKQKLTLAAALLHKPRLLFLDEPTASVDAQSRRSFWELMQDLAERGVTVMFTSHNIEEIEHSHRLSYLYNGHLLMAGTIEDILQEVQLTAWLVEGDNLLLLAKQLRMFASVEQVISFPGVIRVLGQDALALEKDLKPYFSNQHYRWTAIPPNIEDVFVFFAKKYETQ